jgi:hypothetical protein
MRPNHDKLGAAVAACGAAVAAIVIISAVQTPLAFFGFGDERSVVLWSRLPSAALAAALAVLYAYGTMRRKLRPAAVRFGLCCLATLVVPLAGFDILAKPLAALTISYEGDPAFGRTTWIISSSGRALMVGGRSASRLARIELDPRIVAAVAAVAKNRTTADRLECAYDAPTGEKRIALRLDAGGSAFGTDSFEIRRGFRRIRVENCTDARSALRGYDGLAADGDATAIFDLLEEFRGHGWVNG